MTERQLKSMSYTRRAAWRFLDGLPYRSPIDAVQAGARSLVEWCEVLREERARAGLDIDRTAPPVITSFAVAA